MCDLDVEHSSIASVSILVPPASGEFSRQAWASLMCAPNRTFAYLTCIRFSVVAALAFTAAHDCKVLRQLHAFACFSEALSLQIEYGWHIGRVVTCFPGGGANLARAEEGQGCQS